MARALNTYKRIESKLEDIKDELGQVNFSLTEDDPYYTASDDIKEAEQKIMNAVELIHNTVLNMQEGEEYRAMAKLQG